MTKLITTVLSYFLFSLPFTGIFLCFYSIYSREVIHAIVGQALILGSIGIIWVMFHFIRTFEKKNNNLYTMSDYLKKSK
jgi:hypothetical protein